MFKWFPAWLIVSFFGLGYTFWAREAWLVIFAALAVMVTGYFGSSFVAEAVPTTMDYGVALIRVATVLFFVSWFSLAVYESGKGAEENVVIDQFWGLFLAFTLVLPSYIYAASFFDRIIDYFCFNFVNCFDTLHFIAYLLALALPSLFYIFSGIWEFWPIAMIKRELKSSFRNFLVEFVKVVYTVIIFLPLSFLFMRGNIIYMYDYIIEIFSRLVPDHLLSALPI